MFTLHYVTLTSTSKLSSDLLLNFQGALYSKILYTSVQLYFRVLLNCTTLAVNCTQILHFTVIQQGYINCSVTELELSNI
jgi:hypothetical protein